MQSDYQKQTEGNFFFRDDLIWGI